MGPTFFRSGLTSLLSISSVCLSYAADVQKRDLVAPASPVANWTFTGCYTDQVGQRTLTGGAEATNAMTNTQCIQFCAAKGFYYAGTEYSAECYCGNSFMNGGTIANVDDCNMACNGNANEPCGGPNRLTVYNTTIPPGPVGPFINPGVNGFRTLGCYSDSVQARTLPIGVQTAGGPGSMTVALCISACAAGNYLYAGLEYAQECYCSNAISNDGAPAPIGDCDMVCNGNSSEFCGAGNRLNVYTTRQAPDGWSSLGCYTDGVNGRTLTTREFPSGGLTTESCLAACKTAGFAYAGTEYAGECYCGNSFANGGGPAPDGNAGCNMACNGNAQETCGGPNRLNVYQYGDGPVSSSSASAAVSTTATSSSVPSPTSLPPGWSYQGCWIDNANGRVMNNGQADNNKMTVESCIATCSSLGYSVAGMEYSVQCFCDNFLRNAATNTSDSDCSMTCGGNSAEKCGAGNRLSVYSNSSLAVLPVPSVQKTNLTGSWTYAGCLTDDAQTRALPYQIILNNNNTANNCISQCSAFGYNAGGMEYGNECYCGDVADTQAVGATYVSESQCQFACSGNATTICGGARRLSFYTWNGTALTTWNYASGNAAGAYQFLIGGVIVPLVTQAARNGKVTFMEKWGTGPPNTTGAYELDIAQLDNFTAAWRPMHVKTDIFCSSSLTLPDKAGRQINIGGWALDSTFGIRLYWPDGSPGVWGTNDWHENVQQVSLQAGRWYPTAMIMPNGSILVVGGEQGSNGAPTPSLEILPTVGPVLFCDWLNRTDPNNLYPYLAVLPTGGVFVAYYNEARILDEGTLQTTKVLPNMPGAVNNFLAGRTYPMEGTAVLLPQSAPYTDPLKIMICGGSTPYQGFALDNCVTIAPEVENATWTLERMPSKRVLTCMTALADGTYIIINGGHQGFGGFGLCTDPNLNAVLYDPSRPLNNRFTVMANTTVARLYHSEAILMDDGRVLVSGSDPEDDRYPQEYRVEVFVPPYLMGNPTRPTINMSNSQKDWAYGQGYTFTSSQTISKVTLLGAGSSTHGNSIGQRTIIPAFSCTGGSCTVTAPPNAHVCPPGWFQMFALNSNGTPGMAQWVRIGGDPAKLGNWPPGGGFQLPGI
ncbi:putative glyoxal oxidase precursor [Lindgomyces ingoldianus]|uniref:Glyoxal oxidase n=1 Tax=Lindgomyces ingoldianus TaxID=673940 RepID=A0ACB6QJV3_9PLEO|nr:putative glyoxal oxidase precursor [Lindgomyces ingoldianus]KAF2467278.1 putative glyoxal oxidase precursor [Lindgomyces ingoldianus]